MPSVTLGSQTGLAVERTALSADLYKKGRLGRRGRSDEGPQVTDDTQISAKTLQLPLSCSVVSATNIHHRDSQKLSHGQRHC